MTALFWISLLIAGAYLISAWNRTTPKSLREVMTSDIHRTRTFLGSRVPRTSSELFAVRGRPGEPPHGRVRPAPDHARVGQQGTDPTGPGRRTNHGARCWQCGQPMTTGHKHD